MILYHGSYIKIKDIDLSKARRNKDFGRGFYATKTGRHADAMAKQQGRKHNCRGVVSIFKFDYDRAFLSGEYKIKKFDEYTLEWLDFIELNRANKTDAQVHDYDIVEGPVADDKVIRNMPDYESGIISAEEFLEMLRYEDSHQICFCTQKSLATVEPMSYEEYRKAKDVSSSVIYYLQMNDGMTEEAAQDFYYESETYRQLSDEDTRLYMKPWEEIYEALKQEIPPRPKK
jgi:hypothetical protein